MKKSKFAWKASYLHMPPNSYQNLIDKNISIGDKIGTVSNYGTKQIHLHYEILKGEPVMNADKSQQLNRPNTNIPEYIYNTALDPSKVEIRGGKIYEKK